MIHTIHIKPEALGETRWVTAKAVPEGHAKWALFVAPLWLARHRLVFELAIYVMIGLTVLALLFTPYALAAIAVAGLPSLYLYLEGNQLRRRALERRGYQMVDVIDALNEETALARYFDENEARSTLQQTGQVERRRAAPTVRDDDLSFGLFGNNSV